MKKLITVGATVVAVALMTPAVAGANHVAGATYDGTVNTGTGGTVSFTVSADGTTVDFTATGFGQTGCEGATMGVEDVPITDHSFFFSASSPTRSVSGSFPTPGSASGSVRLSFACDSGFQSWTAEASVAAADATIARSTDSAATGIDVFNTTGADQTRTWGVKRGKTRSFDVVVENAGSDTGRIDIKGCGSSRGFKVRYESLSGSQHHAGSPRRHVRPDAQPGCERVRVDDHQGHERRQGGQDQGLQGDRDQRGQQRRCQGGAQGQARLSPGRPPVRTLGRAPA